MPNARQRTLALSQAIGNHLAFTYQQSVMAQTTRLAELERKHEDASRSSVPRERVRATVLRCTPHPVREHLQLELQSGSTTYEDVREALLGCERAPQIWDVQAVLNKATSSQGNHGRSTANNEAAPIGTRGANHDCLQSSNTARGPRY